VARIDRYRNARQWPIGIDTRWLPDIELQGPRLVAHSIAPRLLRQVDVQFVAVGADLSPLGGLQEGILLPVTQPIGVGVGAVQYEGYSSIVDIDVIGERVFDRHPHRKVLRPTFKPHGADRHSGRSHSTSQGDQFV